ncbi:NACHT domain-containing protein [Lentzea sp. NPDC003310]|uniref:NACHT domain-containing protein n=1 Tax=Lentzea sp. NPDC003310 TaxID=3154447 RepID=UPI0033A0F4C4
MAAGIAYALVKFPLDTSDALAGILGGLLALVAGVSALARYLDARQKPVDTEEEGRALADELLERWKPELAARRRRSGAADTLPVQWRQAESATQHRRVVTANPEQSVLDVAKAFRALPHQRAVLLGEPGGGKTFLAISLVVGLLSERAADDKVPVLLSLSSWDPVADDLDTFIVRALAAAHYAGAERIPKALLDKGVIFPVLDGLDELPEHLRRRALSRINDTLAGHRRILLTCRSVEYAEGIAAGAPALRQAPIFEILPLTPGQISRHLRTDPRWSPVAETVAAHPDGPLGIALSTPLMLSLFTRAYAGRDPSALLKLTSGNDVRDHLVDVLIDSVYPERGRGWTAPAARRYLTYLARYLHQHAERELTWWKLPNRVLSPWTGALVGLVGGAVVAAVLTLLDFDDPLDVSENPFMSAGVFGLACTILWFLGLGQKVDRWRMGFRQGARDGALLVAVPGALSLFVAMASETTLSIRKAVASVAVWVCVTAALAAVCALAVGLHRHLIARAAVVGRAEPADVLRRERRATLIGTATTLVSVSALCMALFQLVTGLSVHVGQRAAATLGVPVVITPVSSEMEKFDPEAVASIVLVAVTVVLAVLLTSRWPRYVVAKAVLWTTGRLPLRFEAFLADARDKGLLRAGVAGYEFWHVVLQERLVLRGKDVRMGRPVVRAVALWAAAVSAVTAVIVVDLTQPEACTTTGLRHADSALFTVVGADGKAQCAAMLDAADVAEVGGLGDAEAERVLAPKGVRVSSGPRLSVLGEFSAMTSGTFNAVVEGIGSAGFVLELELYTLPSGAQVEEAGVQLLWSKIGRGVAGFLVQADGSVLVTGPGAPSVTTKDPAEVARAAIAQVAGNRSQVSGAAVLDGVSREECEQLEAEHFAKSIDLRGLQVADGALGSLERCGEVVVIVTPLTIGSHYDLRFLSDEVEGRAQACQRRTPPLSDVSAAACAVVTLSQGIYSR